MAKGDTKNKLNDEHRAFLVREFACFATPTQARDTLEQWSGISISCQSAMYYDADSNLGKKKLCSRWKNLFAIERQAFIEHAEKHIPHAFKAVRIKELSEAADAYKKKGNYMAMADMLERIAKEIGNVHTNRREVTGKNGGAIKHEDVSGMTDEAIKSELMQILGITDDAFNISDVHPAPERRQ